MNSNVSGDMRFTMVIVLITAAAYATGASIDGKTNSVEIKVTSAITEPMKSLRDETTKVEQQTTGR